MQLQNIAALDVRPLLGRRFRLNRSYAFAALLATSLVAGACSGDGATGPISNTGGISDNRGHDKTGSTPTPAPTPTPTTSSNPLASASFWIDPNSNARKQADAWRSTRPDDAAQMDKIATHSQAQWFGSWISDISSAVSNAVTTIAASGATPVFIAYNITRLNCGTGGAPTADAYKTWITSFAAGLAGRKAVVVLEPDALAAISCLSASDQQTRLDLLAYAVQVLKAQGPTVVYIDAGHPGWQSAATMATRLTQANVAGADGFALNVSNFMYTADNVTYGTAISGGIGGKHFIIDTSRNGAGPTADLQWCNPSGRALGTPATAATGNALVDAYLWLKRPGESDGTCNGGPNGGAWWADYALGLAQRSSL